VLDPQLVDAEANLVVILNALGMVDEAEAACRRVIQHKPDFAAAHSNWLFFQQYRTQSTPALLARLHADWDQRHAAPLRAAWQPHGNDRDPRRRLRLGFLSPDFRRHPVGTFFVRLLESLDRRQCEAICYGDCRVADELGRRIRAAADVWREVYRAGDEELARQIRRDRIDVLFDLAGHTSYNRLLVFARKPAPVQVTWLGYEGTTGLAAMDYLLADRYQIPAGEEPHYRERVLRLPGRYVCYEPPAGAPPVGPLPALARGGVTFGSFNNPAKITGPAIAAWAQILRRVPGSRLVLKYKGLDTPEATARWGRWFAAAGIPAERIELWGWSVAIEELYAQYGQIDVALDPFPFSGSATTCDALWMGVPVSLAGPTFAGRHGFGHLAQIGLPELVAHDPDQYVELAVALAGDLVRLAALREGLRGQLAASSLCDGPRFAEDFLGVIRDAWRQWAENRPEERPAPGNEKRSPKL
jgi:predicted O-linked N-acetylglucosamine transferase (SPINDLY family)